jgi:hypothetical protein
MGPTGAARCEELTSGVLEDGAVLRWTRDGGSLAVKPGNGSSASLRLVRQREEAKRGHRFLLELLVGSVVHGEGCGNVAMVRGGARVLQRGKVFTRSLGRPFYRAKSPSTNGTTS